MVCHAVSFCSNIPEQCGAPDLRYYPGSHRSCHRSAAGCSRARLAPGRSALALAQKVRFLCTLNMLQMCEIRFKSTHMDREHANEKFG